MGVSFVAVAFVLRRELPNAPASVRHAQLLQQHLRFETLSGERHEVERARVGVEQEGRSLTSTVKKESGFHDEYPIRGTDARRFVEALTKQTMKGEYRPYTRAEASWENTRMQYSSAGPTDSEDGLHKEGRLDKSALEEVGERIEMPDVVALELEPRARL